MRDTWYVREPGEMEWTTLEAFSEEDAASDYAEIVYKSDGELRQCYQIEVTENPGIPAMLFEVIPDVEISFSASLSNHVSVQDHHPSAQEAENHSYKVGDLVNYYGVMKPRKDFIGKARITRIGTLSRETVVWLEGVSGAYHIDAIEPA